MEMANEATVPGRAKYHRTNLHRSTDRPCNNGDQNSTPSLGERAIDPGMTPELVTEGGCTTLLGQRKVKAKTEHPYVKQRQ
jgi:hypothetical protein